MRGRHHLGPVLSLVRQGVALEVAWNGPGPLEVVGRRDRTTGAPRSAAHLTVS